MNLTMRSQAIYERLDGYPEAPLPPLEDPLDRDTLVSQGISDHFLPLTLFRTVFWVSRIDAFRRNVSEAELDLLLRGQTQRVSLLQGPMFSATAALADDPHSRDAFSRAASLVMATLELREDLLAARLPADAMAAQSLDMSQYANLFGTSIFVDEREVRLYKTACADRIAVLSNGHIYLMPLPQMAREGTFAYLKAAFEAIAQESKKEGPGPGLGLVTCLELRRAKEVFRYLKQSVENTASLTALRETLFTVCLETSDEPRDHAESGRLAQIERARNRWYYSSLQWVVFGNGRAAGVFNFTAGLAGNTMSRTSAEIQRRAASWTSMHSSEKAESATSVAQRIEWKCNPHQLESIEREVSSWVDAEPSVFTLEGVGRKTLAASGIDPVGAFVVALHRALLELGMPSLRIGQLLTVSRYRCRDITTAMVSTPEVLSAARMDGKNLKDWEAQLRMATESQKRACRAARHRIGLEKLMQLHVQSLNGWRRQLTKRLYQVLWRMASHLGWARPQKADVLISHPASHAEVELIGRPGIRLHYPEGGFSLHYQILETRIVLVVARSTQWKISNALFVERLKSALFELTAATGND